MITKKISYRVNKIAASRFVRLLRARFLLLGAVAVIACFLLQPATGQSVKYSFDTAGNLIQRTAGSLAAPQIVSQPQNQIVQPGNLAAFSVVLADTTGCAYQWLWYGTNLPGQTGDTLLFPSVLTNNQGPYSVVVTNPLGSVTSSVAQLWIDSRGCGIPDWWQLAYFGNLNQQALGDFDGDGVSNLQEFRDGTNPTNNTSFRSRLIVSGNGGLVAVTPEQLTYAPTDTVSLAATPIPPNAFYGWLGDLVTYSNPASLLMNTNKTVRASFLCQPSVADLVGWWRGEGDASDFVGGHTGTFYSGTTNPLPPSVTSTGMVGSAFVFYGTNYIQIQDTNDLRPSQFSIEAWVFPYAFTYNYQTVVAKGSAVNDDDAYYLGVYYGSAYFWSKHTGSMYVINGGSVPANQWTHLAAVFDGSTKYLYVNGVLVASQTGLGPSTYDPQNIPLTIGSDWTANAPAYLFNGVIDEVSLFSRALTYAEVNNTFLANIAGQCTNQPIITSSAQFPVATQGVGYTQQVTSILGTLPVSFSLSAGALPPGLNLSASGLLSGVPTVPGTNVFGIQVTDSYQSSSELICGMSVLPGLPQAPLMPAGIVSWWRAENNALDAIGTNHGTLSNGTSFAAGMVGQAFSFNGTSNFVQVGNQPTLNFSNVFTFEGWIFPTGPGSDPTYGGTIVSKEYQYILARFADGTLNWAFYSASPGWTWVSTGYRVPTNQWSHVALVFDNGLINTYVNGNLVHSYPGFGSIGVLYPGQNDFRIGGRQAANQYFQGTIDEASVYNRALPQSEIAALYFAGSLGKVTGPYITTASPLPDGVIGTGYTLAISSVSGAGQITYTLGGGSLPPGLGLSSSGTITGIPTSIGAFSFSVTATDTNSLSNTAPFTLQVYAPVVPPEGLIGWWRGESNAVDQLGLHNGTLMGNATYAPGRVGTAFKLDGVNSYVDLGSWTPGSNWTMEAWIRPFAIQSGRRTIFGCLANCFDWGLAITSGQLGVQVRPPGGCSTFINSGTNALQDTWYHLAATCDGFNVNLYVNGVLSGTTAVQPLYVADPSDVRIGSSYCCSEFFPGLIDEVALYNRSLNAGEIASLYAAGGAGKTTSGPYFATSPALPPGVVGQTYTQVLATVRGTAPVTMALTGGAPPPVLNLGSTGLLSGTLTTTGSFNFKVTATDAASLVATQTFSLQVFQAIPPPAGIVAWWRAETNTLDSIGTNNGFLINNATFAPGKVGQAFSLNGTSDAVEFLDSPSLRPASLTFETWVMFQSLGTEIICAKTIGSYSYYSYGLWYQNGYLYGTVSAPSGANTPLYVPFTPNLMQWYHVAMTFDDITKQQVIYINGVPVAYAIANLSIGYDNHPLFLGAAINSGTLNTWLQGRIDEPAIYNRALNPAEIAAIYTADLAGKTSTGPYFITPPVLPDAGYAIGYTQALTTIRGTPTVTYALTGGSLPNGMSFNSQGILSGVPTNILGFIPTNEANFSFTVRATDGAAASASQTFFLRVATPLPPPAGLVSWWRAENNATDSIGTNNGVALNSTAYAPGEVGQAFALDGFSDCVMIPDSSSFHSASFTFETWFRLDSNGGNQVIYAKPVSSGYYDSFGLWLQSGVLYGGMGNPNGFGPLFSTAYPLSVGQWYHVAYSFDGPSRQQVLYLNNSTVGSGLTDRYVSYDTNAVYLGCGIYYGNRQSFLQGRIDEAAFFNRALTAPEITALYYAGPAGLATLGPYFTTLPSLPDAIVNQPYTQAITSTRGTLPVSYTLRSGTLPPGLNFSSAGLLSGTPTNAGTFKFTVRATDARGLFADQFYAVTVYAPVIAPNGLIGWWRGESNAVDQLGVHNGIPWGNATYAPGRVGTAFSLDGINSYIDLGPWGAGSNWTFEAWVNPSPTYSPYRQTIFGSLANCLDWGLELNSSQLGMQFRQPGGCTYFIGSGFSPAPGVWYHVAGTSDGTNAVVYVNGIPAATYPVEPNYVGNTTGLRIGSSVCCGEYFPGLVDEVSIYNRPLTAAEIASIYNAGPAGKILAPPIVISARIQNNALLLSFSAVPGKIYTIQSENALNNSWLDLYTVTAASSTVTYTNPITGPLQTFFRVRTTTP